MRSFRVVVKMSVKFEKSYEKPLSKEATIYSWTNTRSTGFYKIESFIISI